MTERSSIFDMIGPIMIGPSSSHTGGVVRIGRAARHLFGSQPQNAEITFYNSFARTYEGHGSNRAVIAGLLDMKPDDERIKTAFEEAEKAALQFKMKAVLNASALHPNTIRILMTSEQQSMEVLGISRGGGLISIIETDGFACNFTTQSYTLVITAEDVKGSVASIAQIISHENCNIATMTVNRKGKSESARLVFELDSPIREDSLRYLRSLYWVKAVTYITPLD